MFITFIFLINLLNEIPVWVHETFISLSKIQKKNTNYCLVNSLHAYLREHIETPIINSRQLILLVKTKNSGKW